MLDFLRISELAMLLGMILLIIGITLGKREKE